MVSDSNGHQPSHMSTDPNIAASAIRDQGRQVRSYPPLMSRSNDETRVRLLLHPYRSLCVTRETVDAPPFSS